MTAATLVLAAPASLATGILVQLLLGRFISPRSKGVLAVLCAAPALVAVVALAPTVRALGAVDVSLTAWDGPLALALHVDALALLFAGMGTGIGSCVLLYSIGYMAADRAATRFYALMLAFIAGLVLLVFSANLLVVYFAWELVGLCSFALVGFWYDRAESVAGARKVLLMTHLAGFGLLAAVIVLYARTGSTLWTDPAIGGAFTGGVFALMLVALVAKSVQFPLHTWIPEAMAAPTPVSALLHAACYVKAGVYLAARMHSFGPWQASWGTLMVGVGTVTMLVGAAYALVQVDLKRMLAFSTVSQIGYMVTGLGIGTPLAITAALLHCLNHGFFKGGLFLAAGAVQHAAGTRNMDELGGLASRMPRTAAAWLVSAGSMMGVPLMSGFASKWMLYSAALQAGQLVPALAAWVASIGTVFYCAKATSVVFLGPPTASTERAHEAPASMQWGLGALALGSVVLSVAPQLPVTYLVAPVLTSFGLGAGIEVTWFGLAGPAGTWWTTGGLLLALVSLVAGVLAWVVVSAPRVAVGAGGAALNGGVFTGGEPLGGDGRLGATDFSQLLAANLRGFFRFTDVDRLYVAAFAALRGAAEVAARLVAPVERRAVASLVLVTAVVVGLAVRIQPAEHAAAGPAPDVPPPLVLGVAVAAAALVTASVSTLRARRHSLVLLLASLFAVAALVCESPLLRVGLLEAGSLLGLLLVWQTASATATRFTYLTVVVLSAAALLGGELLLHGGAAPVARALIVTGFVLKLGALPLFFWLPRLADDVPAPVLGLVVAVVDMAAFGELWTAAQAMPALLEPRALWVGVAAATSLTGAVLMLAQRDLKRLLVLSTVEDVGFLLLGVASMSSLGLAGALTGATVHAVAKALLFVSLSAPEADGALGPNATGLATRYPGSAAGFLIGSLVVLGVPPSLGFSARWRLYAAAGEVGTAVLVVFAVCSAMALVAYALAAARVFFGPAPQGLLAAREPTRVRVSVAALVTALVVTGLWPAVLGLATWSVR